MSKLQLFKTSYLVFYPGPVVEAQAKPIIWTGICVCTIFGGPTIALVVDVQAEPRGVLRPVEMKHFLSLI